jgi:hypothetical protein
MKIMNLYISALKKEANISLGVLHPAIKTIRSRSREKLGQNQFRENKKDYVCMCVCVYIYIYILSRIPRMGGSVTNNST